MAELERDFAVHNLAVVTISLGSPEETREALAESGTDPLTLLDEDMETVRDYQVSGTPTTYLIDGEGVILMSKVGYGSGTEAALRDKIRQFLED